MTQRMARIDELLRQEIGEILSREIADPRIGFATVTSVETSPDLRHARVWVSVIGQPAERDAALAALRHAMAYVRHELGGRLRLKRIPDLHVQLDDSAERGTRVLQLLSDLEAGMTPDAAAPTGESLPTPVARLPHEGDLPVEPPSAVPPIEPGSAKRRRDRAGSARSDRGRTTGSRRR